MKGKKKEKILVAMSGGVDSSVAAALLVGQGYDVTGAFMINYQASSGEFTGRSPDEIGTESCWVPDYRDAVRVAARLGIPLLKLDFTKEYKEMVLDYMYKEYNAGRTPNPDVMCNRYIKFGVWLDKAKELGFDKLATGHYAKIRTTKITKLRITNYELLVAKDSNKDQTYFLHQLNQKQLSYILFPLGEYLKFEVRDLAHKFDLPTAEKEESMGICFVGEVPMKNFLKDKVEARPGNIVLSDGTAMGKHEGLAYYTIGQRNTGISDQTSVNRDRANVKTSDHRSPITEHVSKPLFVVDKRVASNELVVGYENDPLLYKKQIVVSNINWVSGFIRRSSKGAGGQDPVFPLKCQVRLRHRQPMQNAQISQAFEHLSTPALVIKFDEPQRAVTPGQFAVFYKDGECLGGGVIEH